jgi:tetratricopeptide (TPR) repeat protein
LGLNGGKNLQVVKIAKSIEKATKHKTRWLLIVLLFFVFIRNPIMIDRIGANVNLVKLSSLLNMPYVEIPLKHTARIEISPAAALAMRGHYANSEERFEEALYFYTYAVRLDDNLPVVWHEIGIIQKNNGNMEAALTAFEKSWALGNVQRVDH